MDTNLTKTVSTGNGFKERLHVKRFASMDAACAFQNKQYDNSWTLAGPEHADKKSGIYAFAGGKWHNVRALDACALAHI